jgi:isoquinoline 1-oxidoreductase subunit beta
MRAPSPLDRRQFLVRTSAVGGALVIGLQPAHGAEAAPTVSAAPSTWLKIAPDDTVTVYVPTPESGNGAMTQCALYVAEELACDWSKVHAEMASGTAKFIEQKAYGRSVHFFSGRTTVEGSMDAMLQVGASARERLRVAAAETWNVPVSEIVAKDSVLTHRPTGRRLPYGHVAARAADVHLAQEPALKPPGEWTLLGKVSQGKLTNKQVVDGTAVFGMDVRLPNMLYAALLQSPVQGGRLKSYDFEAIRKMPGVHSVVVVDPAEPRFPAPTTPYSRATANRPQSAVAVLGDHYWQAKQALDALPVEWDPGSGAQWKTTEQLHGHALRACETPGKVSQSIGDTMAKLKAPGGVVLESSYLTPFCDHVTMEPLNGMALVTADHVEVWHPTQMPLTAFYLAMEETGFPQEKVTLHPTLIGGAFGRRVICDDVRMVVAIAKKVPERPVHVIWSREESMHQGRYRALQAARLTARLGEDGKPEALLARIAGVGQTTGIGQPTSGLANTPYFLSASPNTQVELTDLPVHIMTGPYRGPSYNSNAFIVECFIDECAAAAKTDPIDYRLKLLAAWADPGWAKCLETVRRKSGWGQALPRGEGRGVGISNWGGDGRPEAGTTVAVVARVAVSPTGDLTVRRLDVAFDCGSIINKDAVLAQVEGGTLFGLNMSLNEGLTIADGRIVESNFHEYPMIRMADVPEVHIHFDAVTGHKRFSELGEPPVGPVGPAIANAIFAATGKRIRQTPFRKQDLSWA